MDVPDLVARARYARERYELYRAKMYGPGPASLKRLRELEQAWELAQGRLRRAQAAVDAPNDSGAPS